MHIEVGDHALIDEFGLHEIAGQFDALALCHLAGNGELHLAAKLSVLPLLEGFDIVPKPFAVVPFLRRFSGSMTSEWTTPACWRNHGRGPAGHRATARPSGRRRRRPRCGPPRVR